MRPDRPADPDESEEEGEAGRRPGHLAFDLPIVDPEDDDEIEDLDDDETDLEDEAMS